MKRRNLYRIIIGILMLISGLVSIVLAKGEFVIGYYTSDCRDCFSCYGHHPTFQRRRKPGI